MELPEFITLAPAFAAYRPRGARKFAAWREHMVATLGWCVRTGITHILADLRGISLLDEPSTLERFKLGEDAAATGAAAGVRVAVVGTEPVLDPDRFAATVAVNRGLQTETFGDEVAALAWLLGPNAIRPVLETERLALRWLVPEDAPFILTLTTQPTWLRNIGDRGVRDLATAEGYIRNGPLTSYASKGFGLWCAVRREDGVPVGMCGLIKRDTMEDPELAYAYLERFHGLGYGREAALATMRYAREVLGLGRVAAIVNPENTASIRILEKAGMTYRGPIRMPGDPAPISHYTT